MKFISRPKDAPDLESIRLHDSTAQLFSKEDLEFMDKQIRNYKPIVLNTSYINKASFLSNRKFKKIFSKKNKPGMRSWQVFHEKYGQGYCRIGYPVFNLNKTLCIFYSESVSGPLAGSGALAIYKKEGTAWKFYQFISMWVS